MLCISKINNSSPTTLFQVKLREVDLTLETRRPDGGRGAGTTYFFKLLLRLCKEGCFKLKNSSDFNSEHMITT